MSSAQGPGCGHVVQGSKWGVGLCLPPTPLPALDTPSSRYRAGVKSCLPEAVTVRCRDRVQTGTQASHSPALLGAQGPSVADPAQLCPWPAYTVAQPPQNR